MTTLDETLTQHQAPPQGEPSTTVVLDRYLLIRRLGSGAFGVVWLAHDQRLDRVVAVKRIEAHDSDMAQRAEREAIAAARLSHPGIVALHEAGRDSQAVYLVSELVRGATLRERLLAGELSDRDVVRIGIALCDALSHAHTRGVIHRDIKPATVIIPDRPDGEAGIVKLTDFGIALIAGDDALTKTGDVVGTLAYMAPEQADGRPVSGLSDLYSLALVLYEAFSGVNPIRAPGAAATARRVGTRLPALQQLRPDLPAELCEAIDWAVQPEEFDRGTLAELREALLDSLDQADTTAGTIDASVIESYEQVDLIDGPPLQAERFSISIPARLLAACTAATLVALLLLAPQAIVNATQLPPLWAALAAGLLVGALPRLGVLILAAGLSALFISAGVPGWVVLMAAAILPSALLLERDGSNWLFALGAPLLGLLGAACAFPAFASFSSSGRQRAMLAALGLWWLALAESIAQGRLLLGQLPAQVDWASTLKGGLDVVVALISHGVPLVALVWALAAWLLPSLTRGGSIALDLAASLLWAIALTAATVFAAKALNWPLAVPQAGPLVAGTAVAALVALAGAALRPER